MCNKSPFLWTFSFLEHNYVIMKIKILKEKAKPGLWANIHAKRKRGERPAKPGEEDYPDKKQWDKLTKEDQIPGGLADKKSPEDFDPVKLRQGIAIEKEHTSNDKIATEIAMDHLTEDPFYYDKLKAIESNKKPMKLKLKNNNKKMEEQEVMAQEPPTDMTMEPDYEGEMAKSDLYKMKKYSAALFDMLDEEDQLPAWVQAKITLAADYLGTIKHFLEYKIENGEELDEEQLHELSVKQKATFDFNKDDKITGDEIAKVRAGEKPDLGESLVIEGTCDEGQEHLLELFYEECGCGHVAKQPLEEAEYQGRKVQLNKPMRGDVKKFKVFVKDPKTGNVKKVNFGDPNMRIKKSNPARRKSFRARHNCDNPGPKTKARYWSCRKWEE